MIGSNEVIQQLTIATIQEHLTHAREKHPWPDDMTDCEKYRIVERELNEMGVAMLKGDKRGAKAEALDCIAVLIRIVEGD